MLRRPRHFLLVLLAAAITAVVAGGGCAADSSAEGTYPYQRPGAEQKANEALQDLAAHDVEAANQKYIELLDSYPEFGEYAAGKSVTDVMLLIGSPPIDRLVTNHLGGDSKFDAQNAIYANEGYLYWASRGTPWENSGKYSGIKDLIADRLPWPKARLESLPAFVKDLTKKVDASVDEWTKLADEIAQIEDDIQIALSDPQFERIVIPGEALYDSQLTLSIGKSELALMASGLAALRGVILFSAAYQYDWSLQKAFGSHWESMMMSGSDKTVWDFSIEFLDTKLFRTLGKSSESRLLEARSAFVRSLQLAKRAIDFGTNEYQYTETSLYWDEIDPAYAEKLDSFLGALENSLSEKTPLPYTKPATSADFSPLFEKGRTLPMKISWLEEEINDGTEVPEEERFQWRLRDEAVQQIFVDGIFSPAFDLTTEDAPTVEIGGDRFDTFVENLAGEVQTNVGDVYLTR